MGKRGLLSPIPTRNHTLHREQLDYYNDTPHQAIALVKKVKENQEGCTQCDLVQSTSLKEAQVMMVNPSYQYMKTMVSINLTKNFL